MAYLGRIQFTIQDAAGDYYTATQNVDNTWTVTTTATKTYLTCNPQNWEETGIIWERNMTYYGVFRSNSQTFQFTKDGRAILLDIMFGNGGINSYALLKIWLWNESTFTYDLFYETQVDFTTASDDKRTQMLSCATRDNNLYMYLKSKASTGVNIPFWAYDPDTDTWSYEDAGSVAVFHDGIKLFWKNIYKGAETADTPVAYRVRGFDLGNHGVLQGVHTLPVLTNYVIVQANGTTTFAVNDLLEPYIKAAYQTPRLNEANFLDNGNINSAGLCPIKPLIPISAFNFNLSFTFDGNVIFTGGGFGIDFYLYFVIFEINEDGEPTQTIPGRYDVYSYLYSLNLGNTGTFTPSASPYTSTTTLALNPFKAYVFGILFDEPTTGQDLSGFADFSLSDLQLTIQSDCVYGASTPVDAPSIPPSKIVAMRPATVLEKLVDVIDSTETDAYGFPVPKGTGYVGTSTYLSDSTTSYADNYDNNPYNTVFTSENALRQIVGYPYMTLSLSDFFDVCFKVWQCGLGIEGQDTIRIEPLTYWFDKDTQILELGSNIYGLEIRPYTEMMGNIINCGWDDPQTNKNFASDEFNMGRQYNAPLDVTPKAIDLKTTGVTVGIYEIEKMRQQNDSNNSSPSASNGLVMMEISTSTVGTSIIAPNGDVDITTAFELKKYPTAQSTTPATAPYIKGMMYPETAYNLGLTPLKSMLRLGKWLRTMCDNLAYAVSTNYITYKKQYQQQYNDPTTPALELPSITTNLNTGTVLAEVSDIDIYNLDTPQLFRPYVFKFVSQTPLNMYGVIYSNPRGYVKFTWNNVEYKGFIYKVEQKAGNNEATVFELLAHPDTTNAQLKLN
jgi:hypothetical protein